MIPPLTLTCPSCCSPPSAAEPAEPQGPGPRFAVRFGRELGETPVDGRLLLLISTDPAEEPRFQITDPPRPSRPSASTSRGSPRAGGRRRRDRPSATRSRASGRSRRGRIGSRRSCTSTRPSIGPTATPSSCRWTGARGSSGTRRPGNLYSTPREIADRPEPRRADPDRARQGHPADPRPADDEVHQAREDPERAAHEVLGPADAPRGPRPPARGVRRAPRGPLPAGHLPRPPSRTTFGGFREEPPDPDLKPDYSERFKLAGYNRIVQEQAHQFYKEWTGPELSRG